MIYPSNNNDCIANDAKATMITTSISFQNIAIIPKKPILYIFMKHNATTLCNLHCQYYVKTLFLEPI